MLSSSFQIAFRWNICKGMQFGKKPWKMPIATQTNNIEQEKNNKKQKSHLTGKIGVNKQCDQMLELKVAKNCKRCPKWIQNSFYLKAMMFKISLKNHWIFGLLFKKFCCNELSKIAKSGHTDHTRAIVCCRLKHRIRRYFVR